MEVENNIIVSKENSEYHQKRLEESV